MPLHCAQHFAANIIARADTHMAGLEINASCMHLCISCNLLLIRFPRRPTKSSLTAGALHARVPCKVYGLLLHHWWMRRLASVVQRPWEGFVGFAGSLNCCQRAAAIFSAHQWDELVASSQWEEWLAVCAGRGMHAHK